MFTDDDRSRALTDLDELSTDDLYAALDAASRGPGRGLRPSPAEGDPERGRTRFRAMLQSFRERLCASERLRKAFADRRQYGRAEVAAIALDLLLPDVAPGVAAAAGLIIARQSWAELCPG